MFKRRSFSLVALLFVAALLLVACGGTPLVVPPPPPDGDGHDAGDGGNGDGDLGDRDPDRFVVAQVSGRVATEDGQGIPGITLVLGDDEQTVVTDADGRWRAEEVTVPVTVQALPKDEWDFWIHTRLVLDADDDVNFMAETAPARRTHGGFVAFQYLEGCNTHPHESGSCVTPFDLWLVESNGMHLTRLTDDGGSDEQPAWSQDKTRLVFASDRDGEAFTTYHLWVMDDIGPSRSIEEFPPIRNTGVEGRSPAWSPDGTTVAYEKDGDIWLVDALHWDNPLQLTADGDSTAPSWSPAGDKIVYESDGQIWVMESDGSNATLLNSNGRHPDWSPRGDKIVFHRGHGSRAHVLYADGRLSDESRAQGKHFAWSPDALEIASSQLRVVTDGLGYAIASALSDGGSSLFIYPKQGDKAGDYPIAEYPAWRP